MLEYYQAYATYETLMDATEAMLRHVDARLAERFPAEHAAWAAQRTFSLDRFARVPMAEGLAAALERSGLPADVPRRVAADDAPIKEWAKESKGRGREIDWANYRAGAKKCESPGELVFCAYEYLVEPFLTRDYRTEAGDKSVPVFIIDYPFEVSPLARKKDRDPTLVDRFELFIDGRELCNAFSELNDPEDQAARFRAQVEKKSRGEEETMDYDADYIRALEHGLPPTAGFGMGVDRLTMLLTGAPSIRDVILFPLLRPEASAVDP
jgi:lysyl-tRNA synthetase class 2